MRRISTLIAFIFPITIAFSQTYVATTNLNHQEEIDVDRLKEMINKLTKVGDSYREMLYYQIVDKLISDEKLSPVKIQRSLLDSDVYEKFQNLLKKSKQ